MGRFAVKYFLVVELVETLASSFSTSQTLSAPAHTSAGANRWVFSAEGFNKYINRLELIRFPGKTNISHKEYKTVRQKNWRSVIVGVILNILALGFYFFMLSMASKSLDPVALTQIAGQASGVIGGFGIVLIIIGLIGKKV